MALDETHDPARTSWVTSAIGHRDFPIQNLPFGIFRPATGKPRGGIAIGDSILELAALAAAGLLSSVAQSACEAGSGAALNSLLALPAQARQALRLAVSRLLADSSEPRPQLLHRAEDCELAMPMQIGDYTDFYAGIHHAEGVGRLFRPDNPLLPNYKWVPVGYHGRASSVCVSGQHVRRPYGQQRGNERPSFGPTQQLDFELELGMWIGPGNALGEPIGIDDAGRHIAGYCLLNDWSARDLQAWEYQPLGPFLGKSFHTTVSPWIVTPEALAPFRIVQAPRAAGDPQPLPYLFDVHDQQEGALNIHLEAWLSTAAMRAVSATPERLTLSNINAMYWTPAQLVAHHTSNGCNLRPGDLIGSGTLSLPTPEGLGSLLEITQAGRRPLSLASGQQRCFLEDGDEVTLIARAERQGFVSIGFGACRATVLPTTPPREGV